MAEPLRPARTARRGAPPIQQTGRSASGGPWALILGALLGALLALTSAPARAAEPGATFSLAGDLKQFFFATLPYDHPLMPPDPTGQGLLDLRLKGGLRAGPVRAEVHPVLTAGAPGAIDGARFVQTGAGVPQLVDLNATLTDGAGLWAQARIDRLHLAAKGAHLGVDLGRQPISFGRGLFFTPLDLVSPFSPTVIDSSYKPGVDALRVDAWWGESGQASLVGAWAGQPVGSRADGDDNALLDDLVAVAWAQQGLGTWDLGLMLALNHNDKVLGLSASGGWGPVGLRAEGSLTAPDPEAAAPAINALRAIFGEAPLPADRDPFTRALVGADWRPGPRTSLSGELYRQGMGAAAADGYLAEATDPRVRRGEQWLLGRVYGAVALQHELRPTLQSNLSLISNLRDPSALLGLGLGWSVADNAEVALGGYAGLGARPGEAPPLPARVAGPAAAAEAAGLISPADLAALRQAWRTSHTPTESELGLSPTTLYAQVRTYF